MLTPRARGALMFLAQPNICCWVQPCENEEALVLFEELEDAALIDVEDRGATLVLAINAAGARELGFSIQ